MVRGTSLRWAKVMRGSSRRWFSIAASAAELSDAVADAYFQHASRSRTGSGAFPEA